MYKVGDILRVREWDDMAEEFEVNSDGINCEIAWFTNEMKYLCGKEFTVRNITHYGRFPIYHSEERIEGRFFITESMLEPFEKTTDFDIASEDELDAFLFS